MEELQYFKRSFYLRESSNASSYASLCSCISLVFSHLAPWFYLKNGNPSLLAPPPPHRTPETLSLYCYIFLLSTPWDLAGDFFHFFELVLGANCCAQDLYTLSYSTRQTALGCLLISCGQTGSEASGGWRAWLTQGDTVALTALHWTWVVMIMWGGWSQGINVFVPGLWNRGHTVCLWQPRWWPVSPANGSTSHSKHTGYFLTHVLSAWAS